MVTVMYIVQVHQVDITNTAYIGIECVKSNNIHKYHNLELMSISSLSELKKTKVNCAKLVKTFSTF